MEILVHNFSLCFVCWDFWCILHHNGEETCNLPYLFQKSWIKPCTWNEPYSTSTWEVKWTQTGMRLHFGWKSHFSVQSALYLCSHELRRNETQTGMDFISAILTEMTFQTGMGFPCEQNLPKAKWINADLLDTAFNVHVRLKLIEVVISLRSFWQKWNIILGDKISSKHYPKQNAYACPSTYRDVLKFISPLIWAFS